MQLPAEADVVTLPSGLRYKVLEKGKGAFHPKVNSPCLCHYGGTLIDGTGERDMFLLCINVKYYLMESFSHKILYLLIWVQSLIVRIVEESLQHLLLTKLSKGEIFISTCVPL